MHLDFDLTASLLGLFPEDTHPTVQNSILTGVFIVALFVVTNYGNNLNAQSQQTDQVNYGPHP